MKFRVIDRQTSKNAQSPVRVIEQTTGREVGWINRYLDREYVRRLAPGTLRLYADNLLHFRSLVGRRSSHRCRSCRRPHRIDPSRVCPIPVRQRASSCRYHNQCPYRGRRSCAA